MNELSLIFGKMGLDTPAVLGAAGTKWNFHPYSPGLVGGHCIPVDPYYLVQRLRRLARMIDRERLGGRGFIIWDCELLPQSRG